MKNYLLMLLAMFGCSSNNAYKSVDVNSFEKCISDANVIRLDVRTAEEYAAGHIPGAINIDVKSEGFKSEAIEKLPKEQTIALYCRSGKRSKIAAEILAKEGFKVVELECGFNCWSESKKPIE